MDPYLGSIQWVGFGFVPEGWALCDGSLMSLAQNQALFSLIGTTYGGDGRITFALPNLVSGVAVGATQGRTPPGLPAVQWGQTGTLQQPPSGSAVATTTGLFAIIAVEGIYPARY